MISFFWKKETETPTSTTVEEVNYNNGFRGLSASISFITSPFLYFFSLFTLSMRTDPFIILKRFSEEFPWQVYL